MCHRRQFIATSLFGFGASLAPSFALAQNSGSPLGTEPETETSAARIEYASPQIQNWRIGLLLEPPVTCTDVFATFPIPVDWPEQKVTLTNQVVDPLVTAWQAKDLAGGAKQIVLQMRRVPAGASASLILTFQVERSRILAPNRTDDLVIPMRPDREMRMYLGTSPYIDSGHSSIRAASRELAKMEAENDWQRVEQIYDFVREKVQYVEGPIKNASDALREGKGDCEEMTSLFVALCRNAKIPARMVWIPDHAYPEFYLEDGEGNGYWFPCQAAGTRQFGKMDEYRPVLQKGDSFKVPEKRARVRYVSEFFRCNKAGKGNPNPVFIREQME
ncbi:Transglutaminase-like superfamily protein [Novipirellula aureliae]|uniref:Transglutaminase-like superfamily protein n=1 Tax=Novipirellula aureliae TaxID=2527966 RepID=A0A5C6DEK0_9BACT|nr:transglutaminase-like domain-containing protein [Novipirellula aureliae]TWU34161.1 Transglutaminase-like superfamily protein [Novipirellula aureliae]